MMKKVLVLFTLLLASSLTFAVQQERSFTPVEGATLAARQQAAARQATASGHARFWTAYRFDVRPGVAVDFEYVSDDGRISITNGTITSLDWGGATFDPAIETRDLGIFVLRESDGQTTRLEVFNLARRREYSGYPVFWLGRATNEESLELLRGMTENARTPELATNAVRAISLHDDRRVAETLERIARTSKSEHVRAQAVRSLGTPPVSQQTRDYLSALARDGREPREVRRAAISAAGRTRDAQALTLLTGLYDSLAERELKRTALTWVSRNENNNAAVNFLIKLTNEETDRELRRTAIARLGEMAGERALGTLTATAESRDADTEIQRQAVSAISRRPAAEAVPLLIRYAQTHPKPEIRKHAIVFLGRSADPAAIEFLRNFLTR